MIINNSKNPHSRLAIDIAVPEQECPLTLENVGVKVEEYLDSIPEYPADAYKGRGIVISGGGRYFASAYVLVRMLRQQGCSLPIELWYLNADEMSQTMIDLVAPYNVTCMNAQEVRKIHPTRLLNGWELKSYAILHSKFEEVLFLDADNLPVMNPVYMFDTPQYQQYGAIFWPDIYRKPEENSFQSKIWLALEMEVPVGLPEFESAQIFINKSLNWKALLLCVWMNAHSDFFYAYVYGDKETFNLAWSKTQTSFAMPSMHIHHLRHTLCQRDFSGQRLFQHRCGAKFELKGNIPEEGFLLESDCLLYIAELNERWDGRIKPVRCIDFYIHAPEQIAKAFIRLSHGLYKYTRIGFDERNIEFLKDGTIGKGSAFYEQFWDVGIEDNSLCLYISSPVKQTCRLIHGKDEVWRGVWQHSGEMPVEIRPL